MFMHYSKKISCEKADSLMRSLFEDIQTKYKTRVIPYPNLVFMNVGGVTDIYGDLSYGNVRIKPLSDKSWSDRMKYGIFGDFVEEYSMIDFLSRVYYTKHEEQHLKQSIEVRSNPDREYSKIIALELFAVRDNGVYYHQNSISDSGFYWDLNDDWHNDYHMLMELDAQRAATVELYKYCKKLFHSESQAKRAVVDVVIADAKLGDRNEKPGQYYIPLDNLENLTYENIIEKFDIEIEKAYQTNRRQYVSKYSAKDLFSDRYSRDIKKNPEEDKSVLFNNMKLDFGIEDCVFDWFESRLGIRSFDISSFPDYFETSKDVDKFVIVATEQIMKENHAVDTIRSNVESVKPLQNESFIWNEQVFIDMFQNEKPNHQFSFDKYKMKQDLERRLQTVQDNAEEKGLASNEELGIESEVKL